MGHKGPVLRSKFIRPGRARTQIPSSSLGATTSLFDVLAVSTYNFHLLRSWMQLVQFFIFSFYMSFIISIPICSLVFLVVLLTSVSTYIHFLTFSLLAFDVNGQTSLIFERVCNLLFSYALLIHLIHRLFWFSMYHLFFCRTKNPY
jgi:hypothetical protein